MHGCLAVRELLISVWPSSIPPTSLLPGVHYEKLAAAFLTEGYYASTPQQLHNALTKAFTPNRSLPIVINVEISPRASRKAQVRCVIVCLVKCAGVPIQTAESIYTILVLTYVVFIWKSIKMSLNKTHISLESVVRLVCVGRMSYVISCRTTQIYYQNENVYIKSFLGVDYTCTTAEIH